MLTHTALIADDESHLRAHLRDALAQAWPSLNIVAEASNGLEAKQLIESLNPDVAFLDIKMPGLTGLEIAQQVKVHTRWVFVTAFDQFAVEAFEHQAIDYLLKPVNVERLTNTAKRVGAALSQNAPAPDLAALARMLQLAAQVGPGTPAQQRLRFIRANRGDTVYQVPVQDVLFFQSDNKYTVVRTSASEYVIRTPLAELLAQLDPDVFWQIHRGTVVNSHTVLSAQRDMGGNLQLRIKGHPDTLAVARPYQALFRQM